MMQSSKLGYEKRVIAVYLLTSSIKGVSSVQLAKALGITQKSAWHMVYLIREMWEDDNGIFEGPVEVDETYIGGKEKNKQASKKMRAGRGVVGKTPIVGMLDRDTNCISAVVMPTPNRANLKDFVEQHISSWATIFTDEYAGYDTVKNFRISVRHGAGEYVRGNIHTNGIESFWALFKRGYAGTYHSMSPKHLHRCVREFAGRHNISDVDVETQMQIMARNAVGKRLTYRQLTIE